MATKKQQVETVMEQQAQMPPAQPTTETATREQLVAEINRLRAVLDGVRAANTATAAAVDRALGR